MDNFHIEGKFPAIITPELVMDSDEFFQTIRANQSYFHNLLLTHGALLFRAWPVLSAGGFAEFIRAMNLGQFLNMIGESTTKNMIHPSIETSEHAPDNVFIPLHPELSFLKKFPHHVYFFCETPPIDGGETTIADARSIYQSLNPTLKAKFESKGLTYVLHFAKSTPKNLPESQSWIDIFESHNKADVELKCLNNGFEWQWLHQDLLEIKQSQPAIIKHPFTQDSVWFNQAHLHHFKKNSLASKLFHFRLAKHLHEVSFADGNSIPQQDLSHILDVLKDNTVSFLWQRGDVLLLDNILTMHGRAPFKGNRKILTALTKPIR